MEENEPLPKRPCLEPSQQECSVSPSSICDSDVSSSTAALTQGITADGRVSSTPTVATAVVSSTPSTVKSSATVVIPAVVGLSSTAVTCSVTSPSAELVSSTPSSIPATSSGSTEEILTSSSQVHEKASSSNPPTSSVSSSSTDFPALSAGTVTQSLIPSTIAQLSALEASSSQDTLAFESTAKGIYSESSGVHGAAAASSTSVSSAEILPLETSGSISVTADTPTSSAPLPSSTPLTSVAPTNSSTSSAPTTSSSSTPLISSLTQSDTAPPNIALKSASQGIKSIVKSSVVFDSPVTESLVDLPITEQTEPFKDVLSTIESSTVSQNESTKPVDTEVIKKNQTDGSENSVQEYTCEPSMGKPELASIQGAASFSPVSITAAVPEVEPTLAVESSMLSVEHRAITDQPLTDGRKLPSDDGNSSKVIVESCSQVTFSDISASLSTKGLEEAELQAGIPAEKTTTAHATEEKFVADDIVDNESLTTAGHVNSSSGSLAKVDDIPLSRSSNFFSQNNGMPSTTAALPADKVNVEEISNKFSEIEPMEVDNGEMKSVEENLGEIENDLNLSVISTEYTDPGKINLVKTGSQKPELDAQVADQSLFMDEESCEPVMRKPEPVSNIREETLAGDPRLEHPDTIPSSSPALCLADDCSLDVKDQTSDTVYSTKEKVEGEDEDNEDEEEEEDDTAVKKTPKKRRKPRRSVYYRPRPDRKKREKEKAEAAATAGDAADDDSSTAVTAATLCTGGEDTSSAAAAATTASSVSVSSSVAAAVASPITHLDEDSQGSCSNRERKEVRRFRCEVVVPESTEAFTVERLMEYVWPLEGGYGEHYFVQEHMSQYLGISSFKRKYPDLRRRPIDMAERDYLKELGLVSEIACDMGLMAVRSEDVMEVLFSDFPAKFEELTHSLAERRDRQLKERGKVEYQVPDIDKSKLHEYGRRAAEATARWNAALNREKREERRFSFDLQSFTLHKPIHRGKKLPPELTKVGHYPVAVLPGQYTDQYKTYTSAELFRLPINTVGPVVADTAGKEQTGPAQAARDNAGSVLYAPSTTNGASKTIKQENVLEEKTIKTEESSGNSQKGLKCKVCHGSKEHNKSGKAEGLIVCAKCSSASHASCVDLNPSMIPRINSYGWQCMECKNCMQCSNTDDEDKMIFCDLCDRGFHIYCVGLRRVPTGRWHCKECAMCNTCGAKTPNGNENIKNAEWQHEFKKNRDNRKICYATTLCVPCDRLWKRRQFCYVCLKVYKSIPEDNMVRCANCPKYIHKENGSCSAVFEGEYLCIPCFKSSNTTILNHNRIIAAAKKKMASGF